MKESKKWYTSTWFTILMLLFVFPVGLFLMWKYKDWKLWIKIAVTVLIAVGVVNMWNNNDTSNTNTTKTDNKTEQKADSKDKKQSEEKSEKKSSSHKMNEVVKVGKLDFNVTNKEVATQVGDVLSNKAKGQFIILDITVKNNGDKAVDISDSFFKIKSGSKEFEADSAASTTANQAVSPDNLGFFGDSINPESEKTAKVVFDVAPSVAEKQDLTLRVQSGFWGTETENIELN